MITIYTGTPGSGKSYHGCLKLVELCTHKAIGVISNFPVDLTDYKVRPGCRISYWDNCEITPPRLAAYSRKYHVSGKEGQTLLLVDEAQVIWNARSFQSGDRMQWIKFFSQHRKLGYDVIMIAQNDRMIDKQIRMLIEYEVKHRKITNYGLGGFLIGLIPFAPRFIAITYWYGGNKIDIGRQWLRYWKKVANIYDTMRMFEDEDLKEDFAGLDKVENDLNTIIVQPKRKSLPRLFNAGKNANHDTGDDNNERDQLHDDQKKEKIVQDLLVILQEIIIQRSNSSTSL